MRAFYTCDDGRSADLCKYIYSNTTRLTIRNAEGYVISRKEYPTWAEAKAALVGLGNWHNDLLN